MNGLPCTGKTTLATRLASTLDFPLVTKDGIKELLFETLGCADLTWSKSLGASSFEVLYYFIDAELRAGRSLIAEGNFHAEVSGSRLQQLTHQYGCRTIQIVCRTEPKVLLERFEHRINSVERHPGHHDGLLQADFALRVAAGDWPPVPIECELISVDTTNFDATHYDALVDRVSNILTLFK
ncbi:MAG TPA: AAA family ATPase [Ktedonobacteraceae bacterium]|nr:AAA family ATPase [Ktedonobacteraceae bacterium]